MLWCGVVCCVVRVRFRFRVRVRVSAVGLLRMVVVVVSCGVVWCLVLCGVYYGGFGSDVVRRRVFVVVVVVVVWSGVVCRVVLFGGGSGWCGAVSCVVWYGIVWCDGGWCGEGRSVTLSIQWCRCVYFAYFGFDFVL